MIIVIAALAAITLFLKGKKFFVIAAKQLSLFLTLRFHYSLVALKGDRVCSLALTALYYSFR